MQPPPGWANDDLTSFIDIVWNNTYATFHNDKPAFLALQKVDAIFLRILEGMVDPEDLAALPLIYRGHSAFRAAVQLAMAGQAAECYMVLRGAIENVLYANHISAEPATYEVWRARGSSDEARKSCRKEFTTRRVFDTLRSRDSALADKVGTIYERTIDYGAHPNEASVFGALTMSEGDDAVHFDVHYVAADELTRGLALRTCTQAGLLMLDVVILILPLRTAELDVRARTAPIKMRF
jgi:hypothetical protein